MKQKGYDNNQIVQALQRNGYSSTQIFDALNQAGLRSGAPMDNQGQSQQSPPQDQGQQDYGDYGPGQDYQEQYSGPNINEEVEELVEKIIDEKWESLAKDINKIVDWKTDVDSRIIKLEQKFEDLKNDFDKLHQSVIGKVGEYDKHIQTVGAEVKAMEKVFSKVLPVFTENVNELSRITDNIKKKK